MLKIISLLTLFTFSTSVLAATAPATIVNDTLKLGKSSAADKTIQFNTNNGATDPKIRWDNATSRLRFSNDGTNFKDFGSGSGGGGGINMLTDFNPDFEAGTTGWTASGGSFTIASSGSNLLFGTGSAVFNASASSQTLTSTTIDLDLDDFNGLKGNPGIGSCWFYTTATDYMLQVVHDAVVIGEISIPALPYATVRAIPFQVPSDGDLSLRIISGSDAADIAIDNCFLGENKLLNIGQSTYFGGVSVPTNCYLSNTGSPTNTPLVGNGTCGGATLHGGVTAFDDTSGQVQITDLPPGEYEVVFQGQYQTAVASTNSSIVINDGTTYGTQVNLNSSLGTAAIAPGTIRGHFSYTTAGNRFFALDGAGSVTHGLFMTSGEAISIYRYPSQAELAVKAETINWVVDAYITGSTFSVPHTSPGAFGPEDVTATNAAQLFLNDGSMSAYLACDAADSTGLTCSGDVRAGIAVFVPFAQKIQVCTDFIYSLGTGGGNAETHFTLNKAANAANTILKSGITSSRTAMSGAGASQNGNTHHICETYDIDSPGKHTFVLNTYGEVVSGIGGQAIISDATPRSIHWIVKPLTQNVPAPVMVGSVTSPATSPVRIASAEINGAGATVTNSTGQWIDSIYHPTAAAFEITFTPGVFTVGKNVNCYVIGIDNGGTQVTTWITGWTAGVTIAYTMRFGGSAVDIPHNIQCIQER